jgi:type IV secretory pathway VirB10-like protein
MNENEKTDNKDPSLLLSHEAPVNTRFVMLLPLLFSVLSMAGILVWSLTKKTPGSGRSQDVAAASLEVQVPATFRASEKDFEKDKKAIIPAAEPEPVNYVYERAEEPPSPPAQPVVAQVVPAAQQPPQQTDERRNAPLFASGGFGSSSNPVQSAGQAAGSVAASAPAGLLPNEYDQQNRQAEKLDFFYNAGDSERYGYAAAMPQRPPQYAYANELKAGTVIAMTMITGVNSDLPGMVKAQVTQNVYDSNTFSNLLIPAGSQVIGNYQSAIAFGQSRVLIAWQKLIMPNGVTLALDGQQTVDLQGYSGLPGKVDNHFDKILAALGFASVFTVGTNAATSAISNVPGLENIIDLARPKEGEKTLIEETGSAYVDAYVNKVLNQQPTIIIREGTAANILINKDYILPIYQLYPY